MLTEDERRDILDSFLGTIQSISDVEYQKRVWIYGEPPGTDFDETVNNYSLDAEGILEHYKDFKVTEVEFQILKKFDKEFRDFFNQYDWPEEFIDSPEWAKIMNLAQEVLIAFNYHKKDEGTHS